MNRSASEVDSAGEEPFVPWYGPVGVEDGQPAFGKAETGEIAGELDANVKPPVAEREFPFDPAATVHDTLQERRENEMRSRFLVAINFAIGFAVFAPESLELRHERDHVETSVAGNPEWPAIQTVERFLFVMRKIPEDDFPIHRVSRHEHMVFVLLEKPQIHDVSVILAVAGKHGFVAENDWFDDPADARFAEALHKAVHVRVAAADYRLLCRRNVIWGDWRGEVGAVDFFHALAGQGVHKPRLAAGELERLGGRFPFENLPGGFHVLGVKRRDFPLVEVSEHQVLGNYVEPLRGREERTHRATERVRASCWTRERPDPRMRFKNDAGYFLVRIFGIGGVLKRFKSAVKGVPLPCGVDFIDKGLKSCGLAGLARGVNDEILPRLHETPDSRQAVEGGEHIVLLQEAWPGDIEVAFHGLKLIMSAVRRQWRTAVRTGAEIVLESRTRKSIIAPANAKSVSWL